MTGDAVHVQTPTRFARLLPLAALATLAAGVVAAWMSVQQTDRDLREDLLVKARLIAEAVNRDEARTLSGTTADLTSPAYLRLKEQLACTKAVLGGCRFIYILGRHDNGSVFFFLDNEPVGSALESPPGQIYAEVSAEIAGVFVDRTELVEGPLSDRWGTWVTAAVPLVDDAVHGPVLVLGLDVDAQTWNRALLKASLVPAVLTLLAMLVLLTASVLFARRGRSVSAHSRWRPHLEPGMVCGIGLVFTVYVAWAAHENEQRRYREAFVELANGRTATVVERLRQLRDCELEGLAGLYEASEDVTAQEFQHFSRHLARNSAIQAWEWVPAVPQAEKDDFEAKTGADGAGVFQIWRRDAAGGSVRAAGGEVYYPVQRVAPMAGNERAWGYDLGSEACRRAALEEAASTALVTGTTPITLVQEHGAKKGMLVCRPVFTNDTARRLRGFAVAVLRMEALLQSGTPGDDIMSLELAIAHRDAAPETLAVLPVITPGRTGALHQVRPFLAFGKAFTVTARAGPAFERLHPARAAGLFALTGALIALALSSIVGVIMLRSHNLERMVVARTAELGESKARFDLVAEQTREVVWEVDANGFYTYVSHVVETVLGYRPAELVGRKRLVDFHPDTGYDSFKRAASALFARNEQFRDLLHPAQTRDGRIVWLQTNAAPILDAHGRVRGYRGADSDVTERKLADDVLRETLARGERQQEVIAAIAVSPHLAAGDVPELVREITEKVTEAAGVQRVGVWLFDDSKTHLVCLDLFEAGLQRHSSGAILQEHEFRDEFAAFTAAKFVDANDAVTDPRSAGYVDGYLEPLGITSMLDAVIRSSGTNLGRLCLEHVNRPHHWKPDEITFACQLADQIALAISNRDRRRAELEIRRQASLINSLIDSIPDIVFFKSIHGVYLGCNPSFADFVGRDREAIIGRTDYDLFDGGIADSFREYDRQMLASCESQHNEEWITYPDGRKRLIDTLKTPYWGPDGELIGVLGISRDISERKQAEATIRESEHRLQLALSVAEIATWDWNVQTGAVAFDTRWAEMLGYAHGEIDPHVRAWEHLVHPDDIPGVRGRLGAHLTGEAPHYEAEHRLRAKSGEWRWILARGRVLERDEHGHPARMVGTHLDITDRKNNEVRNRRLSRLREITSSVVTSFLGSDDLSESINLLLQEVGLFLDVSRAYLFRYRDRLEWLYNTHEWCAPEVRPQRDTLQHLPAVEFAWWNNELLAGRAIRIENLGSAGLPSSLFDVLDAQEIKALLVLPVFVGGRLEGFIGFDETRQPRCWYEEEIAVLQTMVEAFARAVERRIAEREREATHRELRNRQEQLEAQRQELQAINYELQESRVAADKANRAKSLFLATMSHEIRTPLTAVTGYADLLGRRSEQFPVECRPWVRQIRENARHLVALISDILDLSKIEAGQFQLSWGECNVVAAVAEVEALLRPVATEKLLALEVKHGDLLPKMIYTDPLRLRQILINLVSNAIKFTDHGGVTISVGCREASTSGGHRLCVSVQDTGIGIAASELTTLFQPFTQGQRGNAGHRGGTGLGLDISRRLARLLGGDITVHSESGIGSTFTIELPLGEGVEILRDVDVLLVGTPAHEQENSAVPTGLHGTRILIVDDNPDNLAIVDFLLSEVGAETTMANNGAAAVQAVVEAEQEHVPYDVIVMDMRMPVMDGYEATAALRRQGTATPIIALTAHAMVGDEKKCMRAGCNAYVSKPVVSSHLLAAIQRQLTGAGAPPPPSDIILPVALVSTMSDNPRFAPILRRYLDGLPDVLERLEAARQAEARDELTAILHRLHGTAENFGFPSISAAAGRCEGLLREPGALQRIDGLLADLTHELKAAVTGATRTVATTALHEETQGN